MRCFKDFYNRRLWHKSEEARELLDDTQLLIIEEAIEYVDNELDVESDLSHIILWSKYTIINRLLKWLKELSAARSYANQSYSPILSSVLWAFKNHKVVTTQTQPQFIISISILKDFLKHNVRLRNIKDAKYLLMNTFIISERPDLKVRSLLKPMISYPKNDVSNIFKQEYRGLTEFLFVKTCVPNFFFPYLINCSNQEYEVILKILEGKSLRKILPTHLKLSKLENAILQEDSIKLPDVEDHILERFIIAASILKEQSKEYRILNRILNTSKIFKDQLPTFKRDILFWKSIFRFFYRNKSDFQDVYNLSHYIDYFESQRYYNEQPLTYSLKGRTFNSIERAVDNWQVSYTYNADYVAYKWEPLPIEKWLFVDKPFSYVIEEITDGKRLLSESKTLHHCVFSYATSCYNGFTHIFSLSKLRNEIKKPFITIEVRDSKIIQIAGKMNHAPSEKALDLIREWSNENNLSINC